MFFAGYTRFLAWDYDDVCKVYQGFRNAKELEECSFKWQCGGGAKYLIIAVIQFY